MPRIFNPVDIHSLDKEARKDYFDRHTPRIECNDEANAGEKFKIKVIMGSEFTHPDDSDHYISFIQLWNRETLIAEVHYLAGSLGGQPNHLEIDFYIVPKLNMNLSVLANCTKHGLWQSNGKDIKVNQ
jgi:superoxide reductase